MSNNKHEVVQVLIVISPYPSTAKDDFTVEGKCLNDKYFIENTPYVVGFYQTGHGMSVTLNFRILPKKSNPRQRT